MVTTETTSTSWFSRLGNSFKNILFGIVLIIGAIFLLFWNEGRAVKTEQSLKEGLSVVISASPDKKDPKNEGKLIHFSGMTKVSGVLTDNAFGVSGNFLKMKRTVEVYQWKEEARSKTKEKLGGGTETTTTYSYVKEWSDKTINSSAFKEVELHQNPTSKLFNNTQWVSSGVVVGDYAISTDVLNSLSGYQSFAVTQITTASAQTQLVGGIIYLQTKDPTNPEIGNTRIKYEVITPQNISLVYKQSQDKLIPYITKNGEKISMIQLGKLSSEEMFKNAEESNKMMTWILRFVGALLLYIGFQMILGVLQVIGSVVPFIGNIIGMGVGLVSFLLTFIVGSIVIAIAWITYRPFIGIALLAIAVGGYVFLMRKSKK
ncbi:hypothetical protein COV87_04265 [Candidatus Roizmanbacteria bacterium CG11_big_fil_rev_8_21_14_0_20_37_16]|uniref:Uncharacterized protein n=1 Tax=Candidatus Roizmanbacteria bacterium CG11_big_fil_rev_8_21_14_0_20_37_16 TaxID=1974857 RepID=A0A2H0KL40_9BACT|nr:MAG: hypothetical protein COV87_04265 [Candidatus Roizmanbacteria bacterium CG11_big_fil_rev_8_21_14_0_20_37_16]